MAPALRVPRPAHGPGFRKPLLEGLLVGFGVFGTTASANLERFDPITRARSE